VIVSYNDAPALRRCLAALETSEERDRMEIIVVDNGSRDASPRLDEEFPGVSFMRLPKNFGLAKAMNIGTRTAKGEYVFYAVPEVEVSPGTVRSLAAALDKDSAVIAAAPLLSDPEGHTFAEVSSLPSRQDLQEMALEGIRWNREARHPAGTSEPVPVEVASTSALLVRRTFVKGMRHFDERLGHHWSGHELAIQIWRASRKVVLLPAVRVVRHPAPAWDGFVPEARAQLAGDRLTGAAILLAKHFGWLAALKFRLAMMFRLAGRILTLRDAGYHFSVLSMFLSGQKIDGSQRYA
jgi:N-acetylglucosaminyl-diphospho-decaprenol L-rhamnosyltransferase